MLGFPGDSALFLGVKAFAGIFFKASVVVALAWFGTFICRRESAAVRYAIWSAALITLLFVPFLSTVIPATEIKQVTPSQVAAKAAPAEQGRAQAAPSQERPSRGVSSAQPQESTEPTSRSRAPHGLDAAGVRTESRSIAQTIYPFVVTLLAIWLAGTAALLFRMVVHALRVRRIVARAAVCDDDEINNVASWAGDGLGLKHGVRILVSKEASMPFSYCIWSPTVVLPDSARGWPSERKRGVLLHEMAHIARYDYAMHILAGIVCAVYWPNILVWMAAKRNAMERERACDDLAIRRTPSEVYAEELLRIARLQVEQMAPVHAVAMAAKEDLTERIRSVLSTGIRRNPIRWTGVLLICAFTLMLTLPLAGIEILGLEARAAQVLGIPTTSTLIDDLRNAEDPDDRRRAAWWLGEHEDQRAVRTLTRYGLRDEDPSIRLVSAWALGEIKDPDTIDPLIDALDDEDFYVREMAVLALGEIEDPAPIDDLVETFDREEDLRRAVVWALGEIGGRRAERARYEAFEVMDETPWENEEVWTGTLGSAHVYRRAWKNKRSSNCVEEVDELLDALRSRDPDDRLEAAFGIGLFGIQDCIGSTDVIDPLLDTLRDESPEVRAMAVWALDEFNPSRSELFSRRHEHRR